MNDEIFEYKKNKNICLKSICTIVHYAENVLIYEDVSKFPKELVEAAKFLLKFLEWKKEYSCYRSLHNLVEDKTSMEDFKIIANSKNIYKEMIIFQLSSRTMDFYEEKERERKEKEEEE